MKLISRYQSLRCCSILLICFAVGQPDTLDFSESAIQGYNDVIYRSGGSGKILNVSSDGISDSQRNYNIQETDNITISTSPKPLDIDIVDTFLSQLETIDGISCTPGTKSKLGPGVVQQYGKTRFRGQAELAVNRANLLTQIWKLENPSMQEDEDFFFSQVVNLVQSDPEIFAAGNCYDEFEFKDYKLFCPYAYRSQHSVVVKDLSVEYPYLDSGSEWFVDIREIAKNLLLTRNKTRIEVKQRVPSINGVGRHGDLENDTTVIVTYDDGQWTNPYFDCGGGDIWMMTYTVPFFGYSDGVFEFKGTSGIDIDLQKVDINQCDLPPESTETNVFANSSKCLPETTNCEVIRGQGFRRGSYKCVCKQGFYFPDLKVPIEQRFFNGTYTEEQFALYTEIPYKECECTKGLSHLTMASAPRSSLQLLVAPAFFRCERTLVLPHSFITKGADNSYQSLECKRCKPGCEDCDDDSPCEITLNWILRSCLLTISVLIMCFIPAISYFIWKYKDIKVLRAASPKLLWLILSGAFLLYCPMIVMFFEASEVTCSLKIWFRELGFSISYGALLLKTWRISMVFRVRSATQIKITDSGLIRRLGIVVAVFVVFLIARMIWGRPRVITGTHKDGLKAYQCSFDVWDYCQAAAELCLLIWGIRLCIVVRKAPSEFNESRFISWAIYNETLLSIFLNLSLLFLQSPANPDLLYAVHFIHTNLTTTVTLVFLFISKACLIYKLLKKGDNRRGRTSSVRKNTGGSQFKYTSKGNSTNADVTELSGDIEGKGVLAWKDVEEELKRVYTELEKLKLKDMKDSNPHIKQQTPCQHNGSRHIPFFGSKPPNSTSYQTKFSLSSSQHDSAAFSEQSSANNSTSGSNHETTTTHGHHPLANGTTTTVYIDSGTQCDNNNVAVVIEHFKPLSSGITHKTVKSLLTNGQVPSAVMEKMFINLDDLSTATAV